MPVWLTTKPGGTQPRIMPWEADGCIEHRATPGDGSGAAADVWVFIDWVGIARLLAV